MQSFVPIWSLETILSFSFLPKISPQYLFSPPLTKLPTTQNSPPMAETPKAQLPGPEPKSLLLSSFMYKVCLVTIFLVLVPLFPSLAPDFLNQTLHARSWEVLQLIFVGIAVSYGLFSKKNDEPQKEKDHNTPAGGNSYVSKLLQVSSVFEEETILDHNNTDSDDSDNKFQMLNSSQYFRGQPPIVVAPKQEITQKPLLLPVRSLKQQPSDLGKTNVEGEKEKESENVVVLPSPIPWRSRSGRMEMEVKGPKNLSPTPSFRKLSPSTSVPPVPPPPPPPPQIRRKSTLMKSNSSVSDSPEKEVLRRIESENARRPNSELIDKVLVETTTDDDSETDEFMEGRSSIDDNDGGPDVDKKADEFIAKFREQIRQQRIESIRKSAAQRSTGKKLASK